MDPKDPYALTPEEDELISQLTRSFLHSEKLQRHVRFLYSKGSLYKVFNGNVLFHGCIPMTEDGEFLKLSIGCKELSGKAFLDYADLDRPPGLLQQARLHGAAVRHGLSVVAVGRAATAPSSAGTG